ncbi:phage tail protein [Pseudomonas sp. stari2]|uniref:phage tail protein n=1 Tax=Pseudomonas sp. Stari2 TaxID=2954814 RepID=UPI00345DFBC0
MKAAAADAEHLAAMKAELAQRNAQAVFQIARITDRIETIGYGIELGEATEDEIAEQAALAPVLTAWKAYKFALGKVTKQPGWHANPTWPVALAIPVIVADPQGKSPDAS